MEPRMYVLVRKDLDATYRVVQGSHAVIEYALRGDTEKFIKWNNGTVLFLGVRNEGALISWLEKIEKTNKSCTSWFEPDMRGQMTAIACIDTGEIFKDLNLA